MPVFVWNILSRRLASSPWRIFEVSLEFTKKKGVSKHCCDLSIRARQDNYYTVQGLDAAQNSSTIPQNLDFEERLGLFNVISERYRTRLIYTIFWHFFRVMQKHCWPEIHKLQNRARHCNLAKPWWDTSLERHLRHGHLRDISINFLCDLYGKKIISDNQRAKHIYPF